MTTKSRESFLDRLRVLATCAVVLLHTVTGGMDVTDMSQYPAERISVLIVMDLVTWCVPVFIMISGYLFLAPGREISFRQMITKYCRRILLALFLFGVPYACLELIAQTRGFRIGMLGEAVWMVLTGRSWSHMWYLYLVLLLYLITPALRYVLDRIPLWCICVVLALIMMGSSILPFLLKLHWREELPVLPDEGIYFFYYICGYLLHGGKGRRRSTSAEARVAEAGGTAQKSTRDPKRKRLWAGQLVLAVLFGMVLSRLLGDYSVQMAYNYPFTVLLSLLIMVLAKEWEPWFGTHRGEAWKKLSALCFTIYLVHPVFANVIYKFMGISPLNYPLGISLPVIFLVILLLSLCSSWVLCRISPLRKYIL